MKMIISVVVVSYNSSSTIIDTLNSILNQDYGSEFIELLICDDHSTDSTCDIVDQWLADNSSKFKVTKLIQSRVNQGISLNINKGWRASTSDWIKAIAADDLLLPSCITDNVKFISMNKDARIVFSDLKVFSNDISLSDNFLKRHESDFFLLNNEQQYRVLLQDNPLMAPSAFISQKLLQEVGYADESFRMMEDYPLWLKMCKANNIFFYLPKVTVAYRSGDSLSNSKEKIASLLYIESLYNFRKSCLWPFWPASSVFKKVDETFLYVETKILVSLFSNRRVFLYTLTHYLLFLVRPYKLAQLFKRFFRV